MLALAGHVHLAIGAEGDHAGGGALRQFEEGALGAVCCARNDAGMHLALVPGRIVFTVVAGKIDRAIRADFDAFEPEAFIISFDEA